MVRENRKKKGRARGEEKAIGQEEIGRGRGGMEEKEGGRGEKACNKKGKKRKEERENVGIEKVKMDIKGRGKERDGTGR